MSGFEALGIASAIFQVIGFGIDVASLGKALRDGRPTSHDELLRNTTWMIDAATQVDKHCIAMKKNTAEEKTLAEISQECNSVACKLEDEIRKITAHRQMGALRATRAVFEAYKRKGKIEKLDALLATYKSTMETHILVRVW